MLTRLQRYAQFESFELPKVWQKSDAELSEFEAALQAVGLEVKKVKYQWEDEWSLELVNNNRYIVALYIDTFESWMYTIREIVNGVDREVKVNNLSYTTSRQRAIKLLSLGQIKNMHNGQH